MKYSKFQRFLSLLLIFSVLFSFTIRIPLESPLFNVFADDGERYNLVSIIVQEDIYEDIKNELDRYANDIQGVLEMTQVMIFPTSTYENPYNIASLNEKLYLEGYKGINGMIGESQLIGTVIVGDLPLPVVYEGADSEKTLLPYTDFLDKSYIYNHSTKRYENNPDNYQGVKAEIWHGVISPNNGDKIKDIEDLKAYFDKNHDFYSGSGEFEADKGIMSGNENLGLPDDYDPYVFYYDQIRESKAVKYVDYKAYEKTRELIEDLKYNRYGKKLLEELQSTYKKAQENYLGDSSAIGKFGLPATTGTQNVPDIQTKTIIKEVSKEFLEIFNDATLGDMRENVYNAGRYNGVGSQVNMDMIPDLVSKLDNISAEIIKGTNQDLEKYIDNIVKNGLARDIALPVDIVEQSGSGCGANTYTNVLYGKEARDIEEASECSIYRGSWTCDSSLLDKVSILEECDENNNNGTIVEANRAYNFNNLQKDISTLQSENAKYCLSPIKDSGRFGGNTPFNVKTPEYTFKSPADKNQAIVPLFDIAGSKEIYDQSKVSSPLSCYENNYIHSYEEGYNFWTTSDTCEPILNLPISVKGGGIVGWNCASQNEKYSFSDSFEDLYKNGISGNYCSARLNLNGSTMKSEGNIMGCYDGETGQTGISIEYNYKKIPSRIEHKSPTQEELSIEVDNMITPSLPIDKNRYISYLNSKGEEVKLKYPNFFRIIQNIEETGTEVSLNGDTKKIEEYLDAYSLEFRNIIETGDPSKLGGVEREIYDLLKRGNYPNIGDVDLVKYLQEKEKVEISIGGDTKNIDYLALLSFSYEWNQLTSISAKYKFVIENYLNDQFGGNDYDFLLIDNKKQYEIAYIGARGDTQNMYIKMDPENKGENPYADIIANNFDLDNILRSSNFAKELDGDSPFKCAPPDGVPLREWPSAIMCRIEDMLPPTISISQGPCGEFPIDELTAEKLAECSGDTNKNGIDDCIEGSITGGKLDLVSYSNKYFYNSAGYLKASLLDKDNNVVYYNSNSYVDFELVKLEAQDNSTKDLAEGNIKVIYDELTIEDDTSMSSELVLKEIKKYIGFSDMSVRLQNGEAYYNFATKSKDINAIFRATIIEEDQHGNIVNKVSSELIEVKVRGDRFFSTPYKIINTTGENTIEGGSSVVVSDKTNLFVFDENNVTPSQNLDILASASSSKEKLFLGLSNISKNGTRLDLAYPLTINISKYDELIVEDLIISELNSYKSLVSIEKTGTYTIDIEDADGFSLRNTIELIPDEVSNINVDMSTTISEVGGVYTTHLVTIYDQYNNVVSGDLYDLDMSISGGGVLFDNGEKEQKLQMIEGYKTFTIKSTNKEDNNKINFSLSRLGYPDFSLNTSKKIKTLNKIDFEVIIPNENDIKVGGGDYSYEIIVQDSSGNTLTGFNSRSYLVMPSIYGRSNNDYVNIIEGRGFGSFEVGTLASPKAKLDFKIEGVKNPLSREVMIKPDKPMKIGLNLSKSQLEANPEEYATLEAELRDRYNNLVFTDNSTEIVPSVKTKYENIINFKENTKIVKEGKAVFQINATSMPGIAYFEVSTNPSISENYIEIPGQSPFGKSKLDGFKDLKIEVLTNLGKKFFEEVDEENYRFKINDIETLKRIMIQEGISGEIEENMINLWNEENVMKLYGVGENAGKIETFYFWDKEKMLEKNKKYNGLYTTLLGSSYGDITIKDYLAGGLLFNRENRNLAVSTLLNNPNKYDDVFSVNNDGNLNIISKKDLTQDIIIEDNISSGNFGLLLYNQALGINLGEVYYNFDVGSQLIPCEESSVESCFNELDSTISLKSTDSKYHIPDINEVDGLGLYDAEGNYLFRVGNDSVFAKDPLVDIKLDDRYTSNGAIFDIIYNGKKVGELGFNLIDGDVVVNRKAEVLDTLLSNKKNSIIINLESNKYGTRERYLGNSTRSTDKGIVIWYNDPFGNEGSLNIFGKNDPYAYENFSKEKGLGWEQHNKTLLLFSSGNSVGESTRDYMSFSLINLGDPVVSLQKIRRDFYGGNEIIEGTGEYKNFDSTIGTLLSKDDNAATYDVFDYNNDQKDDIVILQRNARVKLLENTGIAERYQDKGIYAYPSDLGNKAIMLTGDYTQDDYDDIFMVDAKGNPFLLNNEEKDARNRVDLAEQFNLKGKIMQAESFDMDDDGYEDIITLDDYGEINILYGGGNSTDPKFTKKTIATGLGIVLNEDTRADGGAIYFDGLYQLPIDETKDFANTSEDLMADIDSRIAEIEKNKINLTNGGENSDFGLSDEVDEEFNEGLIDNMIFFQADYDPYFAERDYGDISEEEKKKSIQDRFPEPILTPKMQSGLTQQSQNIVDLQTTISTYSSGTTNETDTPISTPELGEGVASIDAGMRASESSISGFFSTKGEELNPGMNYYDYVESNNIKKSTFVHSEYALAEGTLKIEKNYKDINDYPLRGGDQIQAEVVITNNSNQVVNDIAYLESIPEPFYLGDRPDFEMEIASKKSFGEKFEIKDSPTTEFDFLVDSFVGDDGGIEKLSLNPGESIIIRYKLDTYDFSYGHIDVGVFEDNETDTPISTPNTYIPYGFDSCLESYPNCEIVWPTSYADSPAYTSTKFNTYFSKKDEIHSFAVNIPPGGRIRFEWFDTAGLKVVISDQPGNMITPATYSGYCGTYDTVSGSIVMDQGNGKSGTCQVPEGVSYFNLQTITTGGYPKHYDSLRVVEADALENKNNTKDNEVQDTETTIDEYGDIIFKPDNKNCGKVNDMYASTGPRSYEKTYDEPTCDSTKTTLPEELEKNNIDTDQNGIPDYMDKVMKDGKSGNDDFKKYSEDAMDNLKKDTDGDGIPDMDDDSPDYNSEDDNIMDNLNKFNEKANKIVDGLDSLMKDLTCGFGAGSCVSGPLNRAPLAPGNDPTFFGFPIGDGLHPFEGVPTFAAPTYGGVSVLKPGNPPYIGPGSSPPFGTDIVAVPPMWPPNNKGAGGVFGRAPTGVRIFVTPTLTGAVGIAICTGDNMINGRMPPPGVSPIVPGGNCIAIATPLDLCKADGSDGDVESIGQGINGDGFGIINGNCDQETEKQNFRLEDDFVSRYINYKGLGGYTPGFFEEVKKVMGSLANGGGDGLATGEPLLSVGKGNQGMEVSLDINFSTFGEDGFQVEDVVEINMKRIWPFPDFIMNWVTRQVEEIVNKLTDLPTIFIILPDFSGFFDSGWNGFFDNIKSSYEEGSKQREEAEELIQDEINDLTSKRSSMDCSGADKMACMELDMKIQAKSTEKTYGMDMVDKYVGTDNMANTPKAISGIRSVYEFMSTLPLLSLQPQPVNIDIPWLDQATITKTWIEWNNTYKERKDEVERAKNAWSYGMACSYTDPVEQAKCEEENKLKADFAIQADGLISSLDRNLAALESYKTLPEQLNALFTKRNKWLEQILCNAEMISELIGGRISDNGKRFKAWVETYILIKAVLKSWQLLVDIFVDYDTECHQCKNERHDLMYFVFKIISFIIPPIPVIQFPKWPDIIVDLHNIRAGLIIGIPDFQFNLRPILLPSLPNLNLPDAISVGGDLNLPSLPVLPMLELGELPDLPGLPQVELPNLPPPPKLPKMFSALEAILDILKLILKIMCILRQNPFVPEWRVGDQIAFMTERQGYLPIDFLDISYPQFSFPFIDAIEVTSYVNLEYEMDFIVEYSRQMALPINTFTNNIVNLLNISVQDINIGEDLPTHIEAEIDVSLDGGLNGGLYYDPEISNSEENISLFDFVGMLSKKIGQLVIYLDENNQDIVDNREFLSLINEELSKESIIGDPRYDELRNLWQEINDMTYAGEDQFIQRLFDQSAEKYQDLKNIIKTEIKYNEAEKKKILEASESGNLSSVIGNPYIDYVSMEKSSRFDSYNEIMQKHNLNTLEALLTLYTPDEEKEKIKSMGNELLTRVNSGIEDFSEEIKDTEKEIKNELSTNLENYRKNDILALESKNPVNEMTAPINEVSEDNNEINSSPTTPPPSTCPIDKKVSYKYEGIYIVQEGKSYRLFDYLGELDGDEEITLTDYDGDGDEDIIYQVGLEIYLKENLEKKKEKKFVSSKPILVNSKDNKYYNGDIFYEAINGPKEASNDNGYVNINFQTPRRDDINNFRLEMYDVVDKFDHIDNGASDYSPYEVKKLIIDSFANIDNTTLKGLSKSSEISGEEIILRDNVATFEKIKPVPGINIETIELINIRDKLSAGVQITISPDKEIYTGNSSASIKYIYEKDRFQKDLPINNLVIPQNSNVIFDTPIIITSIDGQAYLKGKNTKKYSGGAIGELSDKPLLPGTKVYLGGDMELSINDGSHMTIGYYDGSELEINFNEVKYYELYDLGRKSNKYMIRTKLDNDFYYAKIRGFNSGKFSTYSKQILISPQLRSDDTPPEVGGGDFRIPVYKEEKIDLTDMIDDDSGVENIKEVYLDFRPDYDSDGDGNRANDNDMINGVSIDKVGYRFTLNVGPIDYLVDQTVSMVVKDVNGNISTTKKKFVIYAPIPEIIGDNAGSKVEGKLGENIGGEPINLYRFRGGVFSRLETYDGLTRINTNEVGIFNFIPKSVDKGLSIFDNSGNKIGGIDEDTGKINLNYGVGSVEVYPANSSDNPRPYNKIVVNNNDGEEIYHQYMISSDVGQVNIVKDIDIISGSEVGEGIYLEMLDNSYSYNELPLDITYNPGGVYIYDSSSGTPSPLFSIFADSKIFVQNELYELSYSTSGNYVVITLIDIINKKEVARVLYKVNLDYSLDGENLPEIPLGGYEMELIEDDGGEAEETEEVPEEEFTPCISIPSENKRCWQDPKLPDGKTFTGEFLKKYQYNRYVNDLVKSGTEGVPGGMIAIRIRFTKEELQKGYRQVRIDMEKGSVKALTISPVPFDIRGEKWNNTLLESGSCKLWGVADAAMTLLFTNKGVNDKYSYTCDIEADRDYFINIATLAGGSGYDVTTFQLTLAQ